ncbi:MAG: hypothetical protein QOJ71_768, partial [Actinomycetota bacterium]|nr:hypothetical protein [Actinomycetota bacterium]
TALALPLLHRYGFPLRALGEAPEAALPTAAQPRAY